MKLHQHHHPEAAFMQGKPDRSTRNHLSRSRLQPINRGPCPILFAASSRKGWEAPLHRVIDKLTPAGDPVGGTCSTRTNGCPRSGSSDLGKKEVGSATLEIVPTPPMYQQTTDFGIAPHTPFYAPAPSHLLIRQLNTVRVPHPFPRFLRKCVGMRCLCFLAGSIVVSAT